MALDLGCHTKESVGRLFRVLVHVAQETIALAPHDGGTALAADRIEIDRRGLGRRTQQPPLTRLPYEIKIPAPDDDVRVALGFRDDGQLASLRKGRGLQ